MFHLRSNQVVGFYQQNVTLPQMFFNHFASKNQLTGFYISGTLVENGLILKMHEMTFFVVKNHEILICYSMSINRPWFQLNIAWQN